MITLELKNFGPIREAVLAPKRFTLLVGPNNAGKSVLAAAMYAARIAAPSSRHGHYRGPALRFLRRRRPSELDESRIKDQVAEFRRFAEGPEDLEALDRPQHLCRLLARDIDHSLQTYGEETISEIERCFSAKFGDLRRRGKGGPRNCQIHIADDGFPWVVRITWKSGEPVVRVKNSADPWLLIKQIDRENLRAAAQSSRLQDEDFFVGYLSGSLTANLFRGLIFDTYYLPAARSGILQSHRGLASFMVSRSSLVGLEDLEIPKLNGVVTDFIRDLIELDQTKEKGGFAEVARFLEAETLGGQIALKGTAPAYPEISYHRGSANYPLARTSSMVSELAPLVLMLRNALTPGEWLVIEEPESHLHPASQRTVARALVRAANHGLNIVATTHSDFLLTQINNCIRASAAFKKGQKPAFDEVDALGTSLVQAYRFVPTSDGTVVKPIRVVNNEGIPDSEFLHVGEDLYSETIRLYDDLERPQ